MKSLQSRCFSLYDVDVNLIFYIKSKINNENREKEKNL